MTFKTLLTSINDIHNTLHIKALQSVSVNLTIRNYIIGHYIVEYEQNGNDRAEYGARVLESMADNLKHIKGISTTNLRFFRQFYSMYPQIHQSPTNELKMNIKVQVNKLLTHLIGTVEVSKMGNYQLHKVFGFIKIIL